MLGEKHNKLYYHVEALERAGLIRLTETRPKRGAVERYYQAVAASFAVADSALRPVQDGTPAAPSAEETLANTLIDKARHDLLAGLRRAKTAPADESPLAVHYLVKGTPEKMRAIRRRLVAQVKKLAGNTAEDLVLKPGRQTYSLTVLFCRTEEM